MKESGKTTVLWLLALCMVLGVIALSFMIYQDFSKGFYEEWSHALAVALNNLSNSTAGN